MDDNEMFDDMVRKLRALDKRIAKALREGVKKDESISRLKEENHRLRDVIKGY